MTMNKNRIGIAVIVVFLLGVIVAGQAVTVPEETQNTKTETYTIGYLPITHALPVFKEKELLEQQNNGVQIKLQKFSSWTDLTDALHAGKIDGASELIELAMGAYAQGIDLKAVALGHRDGNVVVANEKISSAKDLKGKTFAIPSKQSSHYILLQEELKRAGLSLSDVTVTQLAPTEMPSSLASGAIDAYCVAEPFGAQAVTQGFGSVLSRSDELWEDSICCALVLRNDVIKQNKEAFQTFLSSYYEAGKQLDKEEAKRIAKTYLGQEEKTLETSLAWIRYDDLTITKDAYETLCNKITEDHVLDTPPSFEDFVYQQAN
ncbi:MAG: ABC transporter substrate-binding protein [Lachnospiraceae bacterium]